MFSDDKEVSRFQGMAESVVQSMKIRKPNRLASLTNAYHVQEQTAEFRRYRKTSVLTADTTSHRNINKKLFRSYLEIFSFHRKSSCVSVIYESACSFF